MSTVLHNPNTALEKLYLHANHIHDSVMIMSFSDSLANNRRLKKLDCGPFQDRVTFRCHVAFTHILSNNSSILSTYHSNHTLEKLCSESDEEGLHENLRSLLQLNRVYSESQAAHLKIIKVHYSGLDIYMQFFVDMNLSALPHAIAWMARDDNVYQFVRAVPSMLEKVEDKVNTHRLIVLPVFQYV